MNIAFQPRTVKEDRGILFSLYIRGDGFKKGPLVKGGCHAFRNRCVTGGFCRNYQLIFDGFAKSM